MNAPRFAFAMLALLVSVAPTLSHAESERSWVAELLNPELRRIEKQRAADERELAQLGAPVVGVTAEQLGYQHPRLDAPPLNPAWVQVDLRSSQPIDWIALVPAQLDFQSFDRTAYGFPKRFRIDISDDREFITFTTVANFTESDFPDPGVAPVAVKLTGQQARYVRVTVTKFALENGQYFFALAELMVLSGNRNIAISRPVSVSGRYELPPRWSQQYLVDGRTPLGPPIRRDLLSYDGLFADVPRDNSPPFMAVDLGRTFELQEVRLHPVHARIGADVPGFAFPKAFRIEASADAKFTTPVTLFENLDFSNPGNNPVTIPVSGQARAVRIVFLASSSSGPQRRFGLSEFEVYAGGVNVARKGTVTDSPDTLPQSKGWPLSLLIDGYTSYGKLMELPDWLAMWTRRRDLQHQLATLAERSAAQGPRTLERGLRLLGVLAAALAIGVFVLSIRSRQRRKNEIEELRMRLARDLHDEIGSNLASLAVTGDIAAEEATDDTREDWREVQRVSRESMEAMREVLWVLGAREEAGVDLATRLQRTAQRMLARQDIQWQAPPENPPADWPAESRREVFLFFKETLANIVRHSRAKQVELSAKIVGREFTLTIHDDGVGFDPAHVREGIGLKNLRERARDLDGHFTIDSSPEKGTTITLRAPL
ncbi:histidine kinase [Chthoniobacter flavus Ellin428]|uniref:Histidine kinase n=1 Tax=Chthoniobacter flavus Ellin428 TaxID=497964 RepID=B4CU36_9BACT|nr:discoidin domain-containing protein [Chthoniobacter flavus]EDY22074.1 histidine kinase [Chthoniobacter flavus Ellin428]TCO94889.1 histidine kinase/DNA gyrase B/HSP90-like ATPase [Chthoniobacter flavus]